MQVQVSSDLSFEERILCCVVLFNFLSLSPCVFFHLNPDEREREREEEKEREKCSGSRQMEK